MNKSATAVRIVMVDDDQDDLFLTEISFRKANFPVEFIGLNNAQELFNHIKDKGIGSIDVLLLDLNMPIMGGLETLEVLQDYPHFDDLNVYMFSTSSSKHDRKACLDAGAKGYLYKPSGLSSMIKFVEIIGDCLEQESFAIAS